MFSEHELSSTNPQTFQIVRGVIYLFISLEAYRTRVGFASLEIQS